MNWKWCGINWSWPKLKNYPRFAQRDTEKTYKNLAGQVVVPAMIQTVCKSEVLMLEPTLWNYILSYTSFDFHKWDSGLSNFVAIFPTILLSLCISDLYHRQYLAVSDCPFCHTGLPIFFVMLFKWFKNLYPYSKIFNEVNAYLPAIGEWRAAGLSHHTH
jgi:hypothetical protein